MGNLPYRFQESLAAMDEDSAKLDIPTEMLSRIDAVAAAHGMTRRAVVLAVLEQGLPDRAEPGEPTLADVQARLREPLREQAEFLETNSIADEWRTF